MPHGGGQGEQRVRGAILACPSQGDFRERGAVHAWVASAAINDGCMLRVEAISPSPPDPRCAARNILQTLCDAGDAILSPRRARSAVQLGAAASRAMMATYSASVDLTEDSWERKSKCSSCLAWPRPSLEGVEDVGFHTSMAALWRRLSPGIAERLLEAWSRPGQGASWRPALWRVPDAHFRLLNGEELPSWSRSQMGFHAVRKVMIEAGKERVLDSTTRGTSRRSVAAHIV